MSFVVIYDANVLYPSTLRDLLIRVAQAGLVQARWTHQILDETFHNLEKNRPDLPVAALRRTRELMICAVRDCLVTGYEPLIETLDLPDPGDRHVLAAAIRARAQVIVTENLTDFPASVLSQWDIEAKSPDDFVLDQIHLDRKVVWSCAQQIADSWRRPLARSRTCSPTYSATACINPSPSCSPSDPGQEPHRFPRCRCGFLRALHRFGWSRAPQEGDQVVARRADHDGSDTTGRRVVDTKAGLTVRSRTRRVLRPRSRPVSG